MRFRWPFSFTAYSATPHANARTMGKAPQRSFFNNDSFLMSATRLIKLRRFISVTMPLVMVYDIRTDKTKTKAAHSQLLRTTKVIFAFTPLSASTFKALTNNETSCLPAGRSLWDVTMIFLISPGTNERVCKFWFLPVSSGHRDTPFKVTSKFVRGLKSSSAAVSVVTKMPPNGLV